MKRLLSVIGLAMWILPELLAEQAPAKRLEWVKITGSHLTWKVAEGSMEISTSPRKEPAKFKKKRTYEYELWLDTPLMRRKGQPWMRFSQAELASVQELIGTVQRYAATSTDWYEAGGEAGYQELQKQLLQVQERIRI